jgi:LAO/AO transport system kinase
LSATIDSTVERILGGDIRSLARAITAVENAGDERGELLKRLFPLSGKATLVGVTGAPGAGKSTLVDRLAAAWRQRGESVGIIAVDPTSPFSGGAILGDRIRMQGHTGDSGIFIRSMATRGSLGGLARATSDVASVLDAAGRNIVLIETVGVGQDEVDIARLADVTLVLLVPGMGDDVQTIKAGIMEIADIFVINKADHPGADRLNQEIRAMLSISPRADNWTPPIVHTVASQGAGSDELLAAIDQYMEFQQAGGLAERRRVKHWRDRLLAVLRERLLERVVTDFLGNGILDEYATRVAARQTDPYSVVEEIIGKIDLRPEEDPSRRFRRLRRLKSVQSAESAAWSVGLNYAIDHVGIAVRSLEASLPLYRDHLRMEMAGIEEVVGEKVRVAMLATGESRIELLEATAEDSPIARFIARRGEGLHHLALRVDNLTATVEKLKAAGVRLVNSEPQIGAGGRFYVFVHPQSAGGVLLELVEESPKGV